MSNKFAASEDQIGKIHKSITKCCGIKLDAILEIAEELQKAGLNEQVVEFLNLKDLVMPAKWVEYNQVTAITASEDGESDLAKKLRKIKEAQKGKIVQFRDEDREVI